ncbi:MAG: hypothetical protein MUE87_03315 [Methanothrix sp.]|jgi:predicted phosphodiesterase|nr:hypothetical protein [Methanothrix sp.]
MTTILALSDTRLVKGHIHSEIAKLAGEADLVLHAGDFISQAAYDALKTACKKDLWAVFGERDPKDSQGKPALKDSAGNLLPKLKSDSYEGIRIHLENNPCPDSVYSEDDLMNMADPANPTDPKIDLMVFGHFDKPIIAWGKKDDGDWKPQISHAQLLVCPGSSSTFKSSFPTAVRIKTFPGKINSIELIRITAVVHEEGWLLCSKCSSIFYGPNEKISICPEGGNHSGIKRIRYYLANDPNASGQTNWMRCKRCQGLFYGPNMKSSKCQINKNHDSTGSPIYTLIYSNPHAPGQEKWRWCSKCQGLFYGPNIGGSSCPAGGTHISTGSLDYKIEFG